MQKILNSHSAKINLLFRPIVQHSAKLNNAKRLLNHRFAPAEQQRRRGNPQRQSSQHECRHQQIGDYPLQNYQVNWANGANVDDVCNLQDVQHGSIGKYAGEHGNDAADRENDRRHNVGKGSQIGGLDIDVLGLKRRRLSELKISCNTFFDLHC